MLDSLRLEIPGPPGPAKANGRLAPVRGARGKPRLVATPEHRAWSRSAALLVRAAARGRTFGEGPLLVAVTVAWPRTHRTGPAVGLALGDVDAVAKSVLDALAAGGLILDDAQVVELLVRKRVDAKEPGISVLIQREVQS